MTFKLTLWALWGTGWGVRLETARGSKETGRQDGDGGGSDQDASRNGDEGVTFWLSRNATLRLRTAVQFLPQFWD